MKFAFLGFGNMGSALARGFIALGGVNATDITAYAPHADKLKKRAEELGVLTASDAAEAIGRADTVIIACKPQTVPSLLLEVGELLRGKALLSVALGWDHARYREALPEDVRVQFVMPNTPAAVGQGVFLFEETTSLRAGELAELMALFSALGAVVTLPSPQMGIGGAIAGCGPAFVDLMIEALADAGVRYGLTRANALLLTSQMIAGSAFLQQKTGEHPGVLKDAVCSPGGSTIRGVEALERAGFRGALLSAIEAIMNRTE
ncbi:MAG: pyrroline-5-carboxylate reductase [Ruminococcaceae bacterium]|nr:pyrroline-5-carboxylate reductase [Oscillospiraceae bacterium]